MGTSFRDNARRKLVLEALVTGESGALELERALATAMFDAFVTFQDRQKKYGPNNIAKRREVGVLVRADDKLARLANAYLGSGGEAPDDSVADSWMDLGVYGLIGLMLHRGAWPVYNSLLKNGADKWSDDGGA